MFIKYLTSFIISFLLLLTLTACGKTNNEEKNKISIYSTVYPLKYFTEQIGGKYVNVHSIYPNGGDEHSFEPTQKDFIKLADSDLFFYIGYGLEGFVPKAKTTLKNEKVTMVAIGEKVNADKVLDNSLDDEHDQVTGINPHLWLDPIYCIEMAESIKDELIKVKPAQKKVFETNFLTLKEKLLKLDQSFREIAKTSKTKEFLVSHAAFSYWESRYGLKQIHVLGLSTTDEPSQKQLKNLIELAKEHHIKTVLVEQNVNKKIPEIVKKEINGVSLPIHNLAILSDIDVKNHEDYFSISEKNLTNLRKALND